MEKNKMIKKLLLILFCTFLVESANSQSQCTSAFNFVINDSIVYLSADSLGTNPTTSTVSYMWNFGDGNNSSQSYPLQHTYQNNGFYQLCLIVNVINANSSLCIDTNCYSFWIGPPPPSWDCDGQGTCYDPATGNGQYTTLTACQSNCIAPSWDCSSSGCSDPGNGNGQYSSFSNCVNNCGAYCWATYTYSTNGLDVSFSDASQTVLGSTVTYNWDFGDGNNSSVANPTHTYQMAGNYSVCLDITAIDPNGISCTSTFCDSAGVNVLAPSSWNCNSTTGCYDPGTGLGLFSTFAACSSACSVIPTWDCINNTCVDPGNGSGIYNSYLACTTACVSTWNCDGWNFTCGDPGDGTGMYSSYSACTTACIPAWECNSISGCYTSGLTGTYSTLSLCEINCTSYCDSININILSSSQNNILLEENWMVNSILNTGFNWILWNTTSLSGNLIASDTGLYQHSINTQIDTLVTCFSSIDSISLPSWICTHCDTLFWNGLSWQRIGNTTTTSLSEDKLNLEKKLLYITDILGRRSGRKNNRVLFYIYNDGTVEKRIVIE
jgi:PKD repeat protein